MDGHSLASLKEEARRLGLSSNEIGRQVRAAFFGSEALRQQRGRNEVKVLVMRPETERSAQTDVRDLMIRTPQGSLVPLHSLVNFDDNETYLIVNAEIHLVADGTVSDVWEFKTLHLI